MLYAVEIAPAAERVICNLEAPVRKRILRKLEALRIEPRPTGVKKLSDTEQLYRVRIGDYRIIYEIADRVAIVLVLKVGNRKDVYR